MWALSGFADEISPDLAEQCAVLDRLGIRHIEVRSAWDVNVLDLTDDQLAAVAETLRRSGLTVSSVGSPIGKIGIHDDFAAHLVRFDRALHVAHVLGAPYMRLFSFYIPPGEDAGTHRDEVLRRLAAIAGRAQGHDVILLHENEKGIYGDTPARCRDIVESIGSPLLRATWDAANFVQCGVRPYDEGYAMLRPYLEYVQIKDARRADGSVVPAGRGDGDMVATLRALRDDGFDGYFSLEPHLAAAGPTGGFSGAELFGVAHAAFTGLLRAEGIEFR
ncbi:MAG TPA: sugar phosphate isomerase/epimerase family protein [Micromonosporaceae bacterium]|nr:sugar phosphate isomerase/epimerase family protein [Micromonosporaceae bacterium]